MDNMTVLRDTVFIIPQISKNIFTKDDGWAEAPAELSGAETAAG